jgi:hypothetical protein
MDHHVAARRCFDWIRRQRLKGRESLEFRSQLDLKLTEYVIQKTKTDDPYVKVLSVFSR